MPGATTRMERWKESPDDHDYPAAEDYLSLITSPAAAKALAGRLRKSEGEGPAAGERPALLDPG